MLLVNEIAEKTVEATLEKTKEAIDILGAHNVRAVRLHTAETVTVCKQSSHTWPCTLEFAFEPEDIIVEVRIWGVSSGNNNPESKVLYEILKTAGFQMAPRALTHVFNRQCVKKC